MKGESKKIIIVIIADVTGVSVTQFIFRLNAQWTLGNLGKMAPSTIQKLRSTLTGRDNQDDSLITEVK